MEFDFVSAGVTLSSPSSELILREIRENILMRKVHFTEPLNKESALF